MSTASSTNPATVATLATTGTRRAPESYPAAVLAEFIRRRGISFFPEELDYAEQALRRRQAEAEKS